jgi:hypothetical protein
MTVKEAVGGIERATFTDKMAEVLFDASLERLVAYKSNFPDEQVSDAIKNAATKISNKGVLDQANERTFASDLNEAVTVFFRQKKVKQVLHDNEEKIDGETAQWLTTIIQGVVGVLSLAFAFLIGFKVIPNIFGEDGDSLYYVVGIICQQVIALIVAITVGIINKIKIKKKYAEKPYSFEELMAAKYEDKSVQKAFLPSASKVIINNIKSPKASGLFVCQKVVYSGNDDVRDEDDEVLKLRKEKSEWKGEKEALKAEIMYLNGRLQGVDKGEDKL